MRAVESICLVLSRSGSAKPLYVGSIPTRASKLYVSFRRITSSTITPSKFLDRADEEFESYDSLAASIVVKQIRISRNGICSDSALIKLTLT